MREKLILWAILGALLAAPAARAGAMEDLIAADRTFSALSVAKGSNAAFLSYGAEDMRLFGIGNEPPSYGRAAAAERFSERSDAGTILSWIPQHAGVSDDGSAGWTDGTWTFLGAPEPKGERSKATGHYLTVWKKDADGQWKVEADMGTEDPVTSK